MNILFRCYAFDLMPQTAKEPASRHTPETTSIITCVPPTRVMMTPPSRAAMICGRQMVQLNRPRYAPMDEVPESALVRRAKGIESIAAQAQPIRRNGMNIIYWS